MIDKAMMAFMDNFLRSKGFDPEKDILKFNARNRKLDDVITLSLPAGHSCPFAKDCRSCATRKAVTNHGKVGNGFGIQDGPFSQFRCFTAIDEVLRPAVRAARWWNFLVLIVACQKGKQHVIDLIERSLPPAKWGKPTRPHVSGDFFKQIYFDAWMQVARNHPDRLFYAYTKALPFWVRRLGTIPANFKLTASRGGTHDWMIEKYGLRSCVVVKSDAEAAALGLPVDHDDSHAYATDKDFALVIHGQQPAGSVWAKAWAMLKKVGKGGYGRQKAGTVGVGSKSLSARGAH
jgi:hypothetical protein